MTTSNEQKLEQVDALLLKASQIIREVVNALGIDHEEYEHVEEADYRISDAQEWLARVNFAGVD